MSILALIKYPLHDPPEYLELSDLPSDVFNKWVDYIRAEYPHVDYEIKPIFMFTLMRSCYGGDKVRYTTLKNHLKMCIFESDE